MPGVISYRIADAGDTRFLFELKNDHGVRESSILARSGVEWANHIEWLGNALKDRQTALWMILNDGIPIGTWRMEFLTGNVTEVAIHLVADERRRGVGSKVIDDWCRDCGVTWLARIVDTNQASIRLFTKAGFKADPHQWSNGVPYHFYRIFGEAR